MTHLAALLDAQTRTDIGAARPGDRELVAELDARLQPSVERIRRIEHLADLDRWQRWHDDHCDDDETCTHYEPAEG